MAKKYTKTQLNEWFNKQDFNTLEDITGYCHLDFDPEDGYQDFVDACHEYWDSLPYNVKASYVELN